MSIPLMYERLNSTYAGVNSTAYADGGINVFNFYMVSKKRKKLTDMYLDDKITKEAYDDKYSELSVYTDQTEHTARRFSA